MQWHAWFEAALEAPKTKAKSFCFALSFLDSVFREGTMLTNETVAIPTDVIFTMK